MIFHELVCTLWTGKARKNSYNSCTLDHQQRTRALCTCLCRPASWLLHMCPRNLWRLMTRFWLWNESILYGRYATFSLDAKQKLVFKSNLMKKSVTNVILLQPCNLICSTGCWAAAVQDHLGVSCRHGAAKGAPRIQKQTVHPKEWTWKKIWRAFIRGTCPMVSCSHSLLIQENLASAL